MGGGGGGGGVSRVGGRCGIPYYALKYTNFIFLIVGMVQGIDFREKVDVPGSVLL